MNILFFISRQPNPRYIKQLNFLAEGNNVSLFFFQRKTLADINKSISKKVTIHNLGLIPNFSSNPIRRIFSVIRSIGKVKKLLRSNSFDVTLVSNIDILLLYAISNFRFSKQEKKQKVAIEIADLREFVFSDSFVSKMMRKLEKKLYQKNVDKLIVTSKMYYIYHFKKFFKKEIFVLENKLLSSEEKVIEGLKKKKSSDKTIIGIIGLLLRRDEYIELFETYKNDSNVEIHIYGKGIYQYVVEEYASQYDNINYFGPYNAHSDNQRIYQSVDLVYIVYDANQTSKNNKLALPNKLYECMNYKVPILCSKNTYLEERVLESGIGFSIDYKEKNAIKNGVKFIMDNKEDIANNFNKIPKDAYFGDNDYMDFEDFLKK